MNRETLLQNAIMKAIGCIKGLRIFRNNTGTGWAGEMIRQPNGTDVLVKKAMPLHAGLCIGSSDIIGWKSVEITPDMIGKKVAVFVALEVKTEYGKTTEQQINFLKAVKSAGGIAGVVRSENDAKTLVQ